MANAKLKMISDFNAGKGKDYSSDTNRISNKSSNSLIDHFFSGYIYSAMTKYDLELAFVMFWANLQNRYYVPPAGQTDTQYFVTFANKAGSVLQNDIPDMYTLP